MAKKKALTAESISDAYVKYALEKKKYPELVINLQVDVDKKVCVE